MEELIKMVLEPITDTIFEAFRKTGKEKYDKWKLEKEFIRIGEFLGGFEKEQKDGFISELSAVFSRDNMKNLCEKVSEISGFSLKRELEEELGQLCEKYKVNNEQQEYFIESFCQMVLIVLEQADPYRAQAMFSGALQIWMGEKLDALAQGQREIRSILEKKGVKNGWEQERNRRMYLKWIMVKVSRLNGNSGMGRSRGCLELLMNRRWSF